MSELFASGRIVDLVIALVAIEALAILMWKAKSGRGPAAAPFVCNLLSGAFLLLGLRNALANAAWPWIALCLIAALAAHVADLIGRWERAVPDDAELSPRAKLKAMISLRAPKPNDRQSKE